MNVFAIATLLQLAYQSPLAPVPVEVRAIRVTEPFRVDGRLDEAIYANVPPISDFVQMEPKSGAPATEKSKVKATSMPIENKPKAPAKAPAKTDTKDTNDGRPRRIQPNQP